MRRRRWADGGVGEEELGVGGQEMEWR